MSDVMRCPTCGMETEYRPGGSTGGMHSPGNGCWWLERELAAGNDDAIKNLACPDRPGRPSPRLA